MWYGQILQPLSACMYSSACSSSGTVFFTYDVKTHNVYLDKHAHIQLCKHRKCLREECDASYFDYKENRKTNKWVINYNTIIIIIIINHYHQVAHPSYSIAIAVGKLCVWRVTKLLNVIWGPDIQYASFSSISPPSINQSIYIAP